MSEDPRLDAGLPFPLIITFNKVVSALAGRSRRAVNETQSLTITMMIPKDNMEDSDDEEDLPTFQDFLFGVLEKSKMHSDVLSPSVPLIKYKFQTPAVGPLNPLTDQEDWDILLSQLKDKTKGGQRVIQVSVPWPEGWGGIQKTLAAIRATAVATPVAQSASNKISRGGGFLEKQEAIIEEIQTRWPAGTHPDYPDNIVITSSALGSHAITDASIRSWASVIASSPDRYSVQELPNIPIFQYKHSIDADEKKTDTFRAPPPTTDLDSRLPAPLRNPWYPPQYSADPTFSPSLSYPSDNPYLSNYLETPSRSRSHYPPHYPTHDPNSRSRQRSRSRSPRRYLYHSSSDNSSYHHRNGYSRDIGFGGGQNRPSGS
ncbi:hypothetical protein P7C70_g9113, partial [Phenoliferia sp. Uapishka_3]